jgi:hypothetical protein
MPGENLCAVMSGREESGKRKEDGEAFVPISNLLVILSLWGLRHGFYSIDSILLL